jgi:hypothetical protein
LFNDTLPLRGWPHASRRLLLYAYSITCLTLELTVIVGNATNIAIWSNIEAGAGIIAGCLATLRPIMKRFMSTARSIRSTVAHSTRATSRSARSHQTGTRQTIASENGEAQATDSKIRWSGSTHPYSSSSQHVELKSDISRKTDSTDFILAPIDTEADTNGAWPLGPSHSRGPSDTTPTVPPLPSFPEIRLRPNDEAV